MLHIIGTAGHVDHGKTALIEALTGINADRLPEEKKRGMTIDLGFAHFEGPGGNPVGVIDVPGHERFIRNMVAGAWSLSCAVLVVAGDDGWMQQSEDHARVLEAMGIPEIVCAVTKTDIIEDDILELVTEDVQDQLGRIFGRTIEVVPVSAVTGEGIDTLREVLTGILESMPEVIDNNSAYLRIDRSFTIKGSGTVITGSLSGGTISEGDEITILPEGLKTKIRGIQSYYSSVETAKPVSRVACNIQGIKKDEVSRGCIAAVDPGDFWCEDEFIIQWEGQSQIPKAVKNHMELEIAFGTGHYIGTIHFLDTPGYARIALEETAAGKWMDPCLLIRHGGSALLGKGLLIWPGKTDRAFRKQLSDILKKYPVPGSVKSETVFRFLLSGWIPLHSVAEKKEIEAFSEKADMPVRTDSDFAVLESRLQEELENLTALASRAGGVSRAEFGQSSEFPPALAEMTIREGVSEDRIVRRDQVLFSADKLNDGAALSPLASKILKMLEERKTAGVELKDIGEPGAQKTLRDLVRLGKVVPLEDGIYYSRETFDRLAASVLSGLKPGASFPIPEAKEKTGLSRKYIIPLLNKMEENGLVKRDGSERVVC